MNFFQNFVLAHFAAKITLDAESSLFAKPNAIFVKVIVSSYVFTIPPPHLPTTTLWIDDGCLREGGMERASDDFPLANTSFGLVVSTFATALALRCGCRCRVTRSSPKERRTNRQ